LLRGFSGILYWWGAVGIEGSLLSTAMAILYACGRSIMRQRGKIRAGEAQRSMANFPREIAAQLPRN